MVGMTVDGVSAHHSNDEVHRVGAGLEPARTIVSIVPMCDGDAVLGHGMPCRCGFIAPMLLDGMWGHGMPCPYAR